MIKFYFPRQIEHYVAYIKSEAANDIIMVAEEDRVLKGICGFYYSGKTAVIHQLTGVGTQEDLQVLDGLFRSVMFHLMEMECDTVTIGHVSEIVQSYLERLGFERKNDDWYSDHFPTLLFGGCPSCGGQI